MLKVIMLNQKMSRMINVLKEMKRTMRMLQKIEGSCDVEDNDVESDDVERKSGMLQSRTLRRAQTTATPGRVDVHRRPSANDEKTNDVATPDLSTCTDDRF